MDLVDRLEILRKMYQMVAEGKQAARFVKSAGRHQSLSKHRFSTFQPLRSSKRSKCSPAQPLPERQIRCLPERKRNYR